MLLGCSGMVGVGVVEARVKRKGRRRVVVSMLVCGGGGCGGEMKS